MNRRKQKSYTGLILAGIAAGILLIVLCILLFRHRTVSAGNSIYEENAAKVAALEDGDVSLIQKQLDELDGTAGSSEGDSESEEKEPIGDILTDGVARKKVFQGTVIIGDSITESIVEYGYLDQDVVVSKRGLSISGAEEQIQTAISLSPKVVFLAFGSNDLELYNGDSASFKAAYKEKTEELQKALPDVPIYINSVLPIQQWAIEETPALGYYQDFNQVLQEICEELGCTFIDNAPLVEGNDAIYEPDGEHVTAEYYPKWLKHMAETAGLI